MKQFKALLINEWYLYKKLILIPVWIYLGMAVLQLVIVLIAAMVGEFDMATIQTSILDKLGDYNNAEAAYAISYGINFISTMNEAMFGLLLSIVIGQGALNSEKRSNCELFYRTQPISDWKISGARYVTTVVGAWLGIGAIAILNFLITNVFLSFFIDLNLKVAFVGYIQNLVNIYLVSILVGSFFFFASAVFDKRAFIKSFAIIAGVSLIAIQLNWLVGWELPILIVEVLKNLFASFKFWLTMSKFDTAMLSDMAGIKEIIDANWQLIFNRHHLYHLLASGAFFVGGTYIYKRKEIK